MVEAAMETGRISPVGGRAASAFVIAVLGIVEVAWLGLILFATLGS